MIKKTLCFTNPAYLSLKDNQLLLRLPEVDPILKKGKKLLFGRLDGVWR